MFEDKEDGDLSKEIAEWDVMDKIRVLFVCNHNVSRSVMAEAFLRALGEIFFSQGFISSEHGRGDYSEFIGMMFTRHRSLNRFKIWILVSLLASRL